MSSHDVVAIEVRFGLGWDENARAIVGQISRLAAREAQKASRPYCVLFSNANGLPILLARVNREAGYVGYITFDVAGEPVAYLDYHRFGDVLALRRVHIEVRAAEMSFTVDVQPDGKAKTDLSSNGGSFQQRRSVPVERRAIPEFEIGDRLSEEEWIDAGARVVYTDAAVSRPGSGGSDDTGVLWDVPDLTPARPHHLDALFTAGTRLRSRRGGKERTWIVSEVELAGHLTLPTGSVVATDPFLIDERTRPFTVDVSPGTYPQYLASVKEGDQEWSTVAAAKLEITPGPTLTWELGLRPGQDTALLGKGEFYGFGVDAGTGAFLDYCACAAFSDFVHVLESQAGDVDRHSGDFGEYRDVSQGTGANMITYPSGYGDGAYPVWIGRGENGEVTCFVADMQVVGAAELESREAASAPRYIEAESPDRASWAPTVADTVRKPGATATYFAAMFQEAIKAQAGAMRRFGDMSRLMRQAAEMRAAGDDSGDAGTAR